MQQDQSIPGQETVEQVQAVRGAPGDREQGLLADRLNPTVPEPCAEVEEDADGWSMIDKVGGWDSFLCEFQVLEEIPSQHS